MNDITGTLKRLITKTNEGALHWVPHETGYPLWRAMNAKGDRIAVCNLTFTVIDIMVTVQETEHIKLLTLLKDTIVKKVSDPITKIAQGERLTRRLEDFLSEL
jgi:hypothetical protein